MCVTLRRRSTHTNDPGKLNLKWKSQFNSPAVCGRVIQCDVENSYALQIRKAGKTAPDILKSHRPCLRKVIPVVGEEISNSTTPLLLRKVGQSRQSSPVIHQNARDRFAVTISDSAVIALSI